MLQQKPRIRVRPLETNCHVIFNGKSWAVLHKLDIKRHSNLMDRVNYLKSIGCNWSADMILACIRVN